jgi:hypothetical protein
MLVAEGEARYEDGRQLARVAAHHFCRRDDARSGSAIVFLERIGSQLAQFEPKFAKAFAERSGQRRGWEIHISQDLRGTSGASAVGMQIGELSVQTLSPADLLDELLAPLGEILAEPGPDWLIVVDAPDEPSETGLPTCWRGSVRCQSACALGLADADIIRDQQPHRRLPQGHDQRDELIRARYDGDAAEGAKRPRAGAQAQTRRIEEGHDPSRVATAHRLGIGEPRQPHPVAFEGQKQSNLVAPGRRQ